MNQKSNPQSNFCKATEKLVFIIYFSIPLYYFLFVNHIIRIVTDCHSDSFFSFYVLYMPRHIDNVANCISRVSRREIFATCLTSMFTLRVEKELRDFNFKIKTKIMRCQIRDYQIVNYLKFFFLRNLGGTLFVF